MNSSLAEEAVEVGDVLRESIAGAGGVDLLRRAVDDPGVRRVAGDLVDAVGLWDLEPLADPLQLEVAAAASQAAGFYALPYPVAERFARCGEADATAVVGEEASALVAHGDLPLAWAGVDPSGRTHRLAPASDALGTKIAPFAVEMTLHPTGERSPQTAALGITLQSWWLLGLLEHAAADTVQYTREREQFGRRLISFQGVGFQLADMAVAVEALGELGKYTLWRIATAGDGALVDAVALRSAAQAAASTVLRGAHQLHGAMGFTDEVDVSWLSRASQLVRRLPEGAHSTAGRLVTLIDAGGWADFGSADAPRTDRTEESVRYA
ncbi:acyl-CoA dehydrogenase family protein [Microbacterium jejuense]|uniref:acyl-CoA dehydrogenase family protein n=1 Tax=Microbacterium jejuense TaxID=1263637 RepID=UPI0031ED9E5F